MRTTPATLHQIEHGPNAVSQALAIVARFAAAERVACSDTLPVIVEELVCNLVEHGVGAGAIEFALWRAPEGVRVTLIDGCAPFDPREGSAVADQPPERGGGAGLALVRSWAQILAYERVGDRNRLELLISD